MANNLFNLTKIKNCSIKNVKEEATLIAIHNLLGQYLNAIKKGTDKPLIDNPNKEDENYILEVATSIHSYLSENILSANTIDNMLLSADKSLEWRQKVSLIEPIAYFYDILTKTYLSKTYLLKKDKDGKQFWMPELLSFYLIIDLKENYYTFNKFKFIETLDLSRIMDIYNNLSIEIARASKKDESFYKLRNNSPIKVIQDISILMVNKLIEVKYKSPQIGNNKRKRKNGRKSR